MLEVKMSFNLKNAVVAFLVGIFLSVAVATIFGHEISVITSICYLGALFIGMFGRFEE
jgi:uncharacterized membrane protein YuzA (DUF378 family)